MKEVKSEFRKRLAALMILRDVDNKTLAEATGIPEKSIANCKGKVQTPSLERVSKLADYFGVSIDFLIGRKGQFVICED